MSGYRYRRTCLECGEILLVWRLERYAVPMLPDGLWPRIAAAQDAHTAETGHTQARTQLGEATAEEAEAAEVSA